jgi:hypothetical protein
MEVSALFAAAFFRTPPGAILLLAVLLVCTYFLVSRFIRIQVPVDDEAADLEEEADADLEVEPEGDRLAHYEGEDLPPPAKAAEEPPRTLCIEAIRVNDVRLQLGDTASRVMAAFPAGAGELLPMVERGSGGQAGSVTRTYRAGRQMVNLTLERDEPEQPLRLTKIEIEAS